MPSNDLTSRCGRVAHSSVVELGGSGEEFEGVDMGWANNSEVAFVEGSDDCLVETFSNSDSGGVDDVEVEVAVGAAKFPGALPVNGGEIDGLDGSQQRCTSTVVP